MANFRDSRTSLFVLAAVSTVRSPNALAGIFDARVAGIAVGSTINVFNDVKDRQAGIRTLRSFAVEDGKPGAQRA